MFDDMMGAYGGRFFIAAAGVAVALLLLVAVLWLMRNRAPSPFVRGGKNRQPRLQVLDAAAIDARRRLVLVRRDDVEHLVMIGGPTDVVIESRIVPREQEAVTMVPVAAPPQVAAEFPPRQPRMEPRAPIQPPPVERPASRLPERVEPAVPSQAAAVATRPAAPERPADARPLASDGQTAETAEILEAARQRVMPVRPEAPVAAPAVFSPPGQPARTQQPGHDFQRILEDEMSNNLVAERLAPRPGAAPSNPLPRQGQAAPAPQQQRRDPEMTPVAGSDAALQKEVARIFGEMSVNRDH